MWSVEYRLESAFITYFFAVRRAIQHHTGFIPEITQRDKKDNQLHFHDNSETTALVFLNYSH